ncbi:hypothetical protein PAXRUDRAFT_415876 [Paxillus rubicundulus Ve08.2h10]|uniref:Uncharacterized protein n=1 Tax=Paxillus rubicundulus Ve08.2h10 TaxID=930991 RepID=A0A0D0D8L5_9AGAM|nr:hypothetical protein PAXRUDRAFT_415876 [Paxillus rubicundulus Ve08.2h10]
MHNQQTSRDVTSCDTWLEWMVLQCYPATGVERFHFWIVPGHLTITKLLSQETKITMWY